MWRAMAYLLCRIEGLSRRVLVRVAIIDLERREERVFEADVDADLCGS